MLLSMYRYFWSTALCLLLFGRYVASSVDLPQFEGADATETPDREPLILTRYVEKGLIREGQEAARVHGILEGLESYSGYFTVNTTHGRNLFFWYFPAEESPETAPVITWQQGGPGGSSMFGLVGEHGPIQIGSGGSVKLRPYRWTRTHHVIYIDSPAGTGFSFPEPGRRQHFGETEISSDLHEFLQQFFQLFPKLLGNDYYVAGESYAGYMVPSTAHAIHVNNPTAKVKINLKGLMIGNGIVNLHWGASNDYCTQVGLNASESPCCRYNYINPEESSLLGSTVVRFFNLDWVQEKIHVAKVNFQNINQRVSSLVWASDRDFELAPVLRDLLQHYDVLYYNGQLDCVCPYPYVEEFLLALDWTGSSEYHGAKRVQWKVAGELAGYIKNGGNLTSALVRNAGHMVPADQPEWALNLVSRFIKKAIP